ncbi:MAG: threonine ammonia-lyase IlvA, partial [Bacteroidota bacterium]
METITTYSPQLEQVQQAALALKSVIVKTPLTRSERLSKMMNCDVWLKREDLQPVRSYKIRGAYHKINSIPPEERGKGIVCASAGNHAQGVAFSCRTLEVQGTIYMPQTTPTQKIEQVRMFGEDFVTIELAGDSFDDSYAIALEVARGTGRHFVHPFDDPQVIEGQATVALEILEQATRPPDFVFIPVGGGGLASGLGTIIKQLSPGTKVIGVEPLGAPAMKRSLDEGQHITLDAIDTFVDGAAVRKVGKLTLPICRESLDAVVTVPEGKICETLLQLYNRDAIVVEPAGAMSMAALDLFSEEIKGRQVVCVVSGGNNDITRTAEIKERALLYNNLKHYFIVKFPQRAGALKQFVADILGPDDDITHFEYTKKSNR